MAASERVFKMSDHDAPTTPALRQRLIEAGRLSVVSDKGGSGGAVKCGLCGCNISSDPDADPVIPACGSCKLRPEAQRLRSPQFQRAFTEADKSMIRKIHGYVPAKQLLGILNDRLRSDLGDDEPLYTIEQLHAEIAAIQGGAMKADQGWAGLRKLLANAKRAGTLGQITDQVIHDFAIVFSLSPKQHMRLKDILLQPEED